MYFPVEVFRYIIEFNGINNYFPKQLINILRNASADDLERILKSVIHIDYKFNHKDLSTQRRKILLKILFKQSHKELIFTRIVSNYDLMKNIYSFHNYGFKIGDEVLWFKGHGITHCGIITKINHKSIKIKCYDYEIKPAEHWDGRTVLYRYWIKTSCQKHASFTDEISRLYKNDRQDTTLVRENFYRIRHY